MSDYNSQDDNLEQAVESLEDQSAEMSRALHEAGDEVGGSAAGLGDEFREFGRQLVRAVRAVAGSDELRHLGNEIADSLRQIGDEVQDAFDRTREREEIRAVGQQARRVGQALSGGNGTVGDVQGSLAKALRSLNDELNKVVDQVQSRTARIGDNVDSSARDAAETVQDEMQGAWETASDHVEEAVDEVEESGRSVWDEATESADEVKQDIQDSWNDATDSHSDERG